MILLIMGVSGTGKSTIGSMLATELKLQFIEGDNYHPSANIEKMQNGESLTDEDRRPWLANLANIIRQFYQEGKGVVISCSALKASYRHQLSLACPEIRIIHLFGTPKLIRQRLSNRQRHFMPADLLDSQIKSLEQPENAITIDVTSNPKQILQQIITGLK